MGRRSTTVTLKPQSGGLVGAEGVEPSPDGHLPSPGLIRPRATPVVAPLLTRYLVRKMRDAAGFYRRDIRRLNMAQLHYTRSGSRRNPKVSLSVAHEAVGHDKAVYERLLEYFRGLARTNGHPA